MNLGVSAVYLFKVRQVALQDRSMFIAKYGFTKNLARRSKEHARLYGPSIELATKSMIQTEYLREAEHELRRSFIGAGILHAGPRLLTYYNVPRGRELIIFPNEYTDMILDIYRDIEINYEFKSPF